MSPNRQPDPPAAHARRTRSAGRVPASRAAKPKLADPKVPPRDRTKRRATKGRSHPARGASTKPFERPK
jgi:hypothetical protein